ncbi:acetyltransferase [Nonlabens spongiae]|uniref:Acetyltransferase n=1 Tax=Nonlabens spongiae TaxID=331648 RepID=A0A1W6MLK0_9FLAO|nr:acetyltransferase [Nonlabens spongiae]ARN78494.1 acetyltransferase [Nonlabens spongiae]
MNRKELEQEYINLGNVLSTYYPNKSFQNHCYWRIALDNTLHEQWNKQISSPAYKNLTDEQLVNTIDLLRLYIKDEELLEKHNRLSLIYRGKISVS